MNTIDKILLRLNILIRRRLGYRIPQLNEARPIRTSRFAVYRHYGRIVRLEPLSYEERRQVAEKQKELDVEYIHAKSRAMQQWSEELSARLGRKPTSDEIDEWELRYECENEHEEYRPCDKCAFHPIVGNVLPCPHYNVIEGSTRHACCTHKYVIIKDIEKL